MGYFYEQAHVLIEHGGSVLPCPGAAELHYAEVKALSMKP